MAAKEQAISAAQKARSQKRAIATGNYGIQFASCCDVESIGYRPAPSMAGVTAFTGTPARLFAQVLPNTIFSTEGISVG
jgi:hypothetical protein